MVAVTHTHECRPTEIKKYPANIRLLAKTIEDISPKYLFLMILLPFSSSRKCEATHLLTSSFNDFQLRLMTGLLALRNDMKDVN